MSRKDELSLKIINSYEEKLIKNNLYRNLLFSAIGISSLALLAGIQNASSLETTISADTTVGDLTVPKGDILHISRNATLTITGTLTNYGLIDTHASNLFIKGTLINNGTIDHHGIISNAGILENHALIESGGGIFQNMPTGIFNNFGEVDLSTAGSSGPFRNSGVINNEPGGFIGASPGGPAITNDVTGIINNFGGLCAFSNYIVNEGIIYNMQSGGICASGSNYWGLAGLNNLINGTINNYGDVFVGSFSTYTNGGTFDNFCTGTYENTGPFVGNPIINKCHPDPKKAINNLVKSGNSFGANTDVLGIAVKLLTDSNPRDDIGACGKLGTFINQVNADYGLTIAQKSHLVSVAKAIKTSIGC